MLSKISQKDMEEFADKYCGNIKGFNRHRFVKETVALKRQIRGGDSVAPFHQKLLDKWTKSIFNKNPDYSVYDSPAILQDIWACWTMYSRAYIKMLSEKECNGVPVLEHLGEVNKILDIGNGIGYSSAALKELFPDADVIGFNMKESFQYDICLKVASAYNFRMMHKLESVGDVDVLFASEYFEHHERPIEHLQEVINAVNPKHIIVANSFGTIAIGHFDAYKHGNSVLGIKQTRKAFNDFLKNHNYVKNKTSFWNDRPNFWTRK